MLLWSVLLWSVLLWSVLLWSAVSGVVVSVVVVSGVEHSCLVSGHRVVVGVDGLVIAGDHVVIRHVELSVCLDNHVSTARLQHQDQQHRTEPDGTTAEPQHPGSVISLRTEAEPPPE